MSELPFDEDALTRLRQHANPARAAGAARYMKTTDPFLGVRAPELAQIVRALKASAHRPPDAATVRAQAAALWAHPEREAQYLAISWCRAWPKLVTLDALPLYERLIREGCWWDTVDNVASNLVGLLWRRHPDTLGPLMDTWVDENPGTRAHDPSTWIRRTAIIGQIKHRDDVDLDRLFAYCARRADEREFFIRKAIGWALRAASQHHPDAVEDFLDAHRDKLSGLSYREARKRLDRA